MPEPVRVIRLDDVSPLRSQAVYHALGHSMSPSQPVDTIVLVTPGERYVSIGYHQELEREVDTEACGRLGLRIVRREVGGGAVLLDDGQVFTQWVFAPKSLPVVLEHRFGAFAEPLLRTYEDFGIHAQFRPVNDIQVGARKIGGTGAARMSESEVVVGSLMFDFDPETMAQVLKVSSVKMRDKVSQALREYVTSMTRELGEAPPREEVLKSYIAQAEASLGRRIEPGGLTAKEEAAMAEWEARMAQPAWTERKTRRISPGVRISTDVNVYESEHKAPGGLVRGTVTVHVGEIHDAVISGDFTVLPSNAVELLEKRLVGCPATDGAVATVVAGWLEGVQAPGIGVDDIVEVLHVPA